ncbi:ATP-binding cassette sub- G member 1 [Phlyctochytrium bullatum]|nr:ATP-binding cassette sub- G member 1 [Phlyctochytrium bullatum]
MPNRLPPRDARVSADRVAFGKSHESLGGAGAGQQERSRSQLVSNTSEDGGVPARGERGTRSVIEARAPSLGRKVPEGGWLGGQPAAENQREGESLAALHLASPRGSTAVAKSNDSLARPWKSRSKINSATTTPQASSPTAAEKEEQRLALATGQALSPTASALYLASSRDVLGSSFQLTHVVPEEDETSRVPSRVPSAVVPQHQAQPKDLLEAMIIAERQLAAEQQQQKQQPERHFESERSCMSAGHGGVAHVQPRASSVHSSHHKRSVETITALPPLTSIPLSSAPVVQNPEPVVQTCKVALVEEDEEEEETDARPADTSKHDTSSVVNHIPHKLPPISQSHTRQPSNASMQHRHIPDNARMPPQLSYDERGETASVGGSETSSQMGLQPFRSNTQKMPASNQNAGADGDKLSLRYFKSDEDLLSMALGTVKPQHRIELVFRDLTFTVESKDVVGKAKKTETVEQRTLLGTAREMVNRITGKGGPKVQSRQILKGITGMFRPGRFTVIMGASGAGKTSLLNVIAGEAKGGTVSGEILINNKRVSGEEIRNISGFVFQDDVILSTMTVKEGLAGTGRTVIATLHQPSSEIFRLFDDFILMAEGKILYMGPARHAVKYFAGLGYACPRYSNPTDYFFMSILNNEPDTFHYANTPGSGNQDGGDSKNDGLTPTERMQKLLDAWEISPEKAKIMERIESSTERTINTKVTRSMRSWWTQFSFLYQRSAKNAIRNPLVVRSKAVQVGFTCLLIGLLYLDTDKKVGQVAIQNRIGVLFFLAVSNLMTASTSNLSVFAKEKSVYVREFSAGYYYTAPYFLGKFLAELPLYFVFPALQTLIVYYMTGLQKS